MRKKIFPIFLLAAAACFAVSCEKEDSLSENPTNPNNQRLSKFSGSIEQLASDSKTHLGQNDVVEWDNDDPIVINGQSYTASPSGTDATKAQFRTSEATDVDPIGGYYTAYYPASIYKGGRPTLPAVQQYTAGHIDNLPMYAKSNTTSLQFHNICGVMELNLKGSKSVMAISVTAMDNTALNGPFSVDDNNKAVISSCSQASQRTVTLDCGTGVQLNTSTDTKFWIALPAFQNKQLLLTVRATDGTCLLKKTVANVTMEANHIQEIKLTLADGEFKKMSGYFQGANKRILQFACGNLKNESGTYSFFDDQTEYVKSDEVSARQNVDLFTYAELSTLTSGEFHRTFNAYPTISGDNTWEVLSFEDWESIIGNSRPGSSVNGTAGRHFAGVQIDGVNYTLICPDNAVIRGAANITNWDQYEDDFVSLSDEDWQVYEKAGCVLLPAAGGFNGSSVILVGIVGYYWSSTSYTDQIAGCFMFDGGSLIVDGNFKDSGFSVRLAQAF